MPVPPVPTVSCLAKVVPTSVKMEEVQRLREKLRCLEDEKAGMVVRHKAQLLRFKRALQEVRNQVNWLNNLLTQCNNDCAELRKQLAEVKSHF